MAKPEFVRVKVPETGAEISVLTTAVQPGMKILDGKPATGIDGKPLPPKAVKPKAAVTTTARTQPQTDLDSKEN